jgi:hypothetical protein
MTKHPNDDYMRQELMKDCAETTAKMMADSEALSEYAEGGLLRPGNVVSLMDGDRTVGAAQVAEDGTVTWEGPIPQFTDITVTVPGSDKPMKVRIDPGQTFPEEPTYVDGGIIRGEGGSGQSGFWYRGVWIGSGGAGLAEGSQPISASGGGGGGYPRTWGVMFRQPPLVCPNCGSPDEKTRALVGPSMEPGPCEDLWHGPIEWDSDWAERTFCDCHRPDGLHLLNCEWVGRRLRAEDRDREIRWLASNRFHTPEDQPPPDVQDYLERIHGEPAANLGEVLERDLAESINKPLDAAVLRGEQVTLGEGEDAHEQIGPGESVYPEDDPGTTAKPEEVRRHLRELKAAASGRSGRSDLSVKISEDGLGAVDCSLGQPSTVGQWADRVRLKLAELEGTPVEPDDRALLREWIAQTRAVLPGSEAPPDRSDLLFKSADLTGNHVSGREPLSARTWAMIAFYGTLMNLMLTVPAFAMGLIAVDVLYRHLH